MQQNGGSNASDDDDHLIRPNILMILVDQLYYPNAGYGDAGFVNELKQILSFVGNLEGNSYAQYFPGLVKLR